MVRPIATRFVRLLDRFDEQLQVDCERMKRELYARVDQQFGVIRATVNELKIRFSRFRTSSSSLNIEGIFADNPSVEVISFGAYLEGKRSEAAAELQNASTSSGNRKRKQQTGAAASKNAKKAKTQSTGQNVTMFACKFPGCDRSFPRDSKLANHERIHLNIKPYFCTWPNCKYACEQRSHIVRHIRFVHFKLPRSVKKQNELNMIDDRDPNEFVRSDQQLANRRL